MRIWLAYGLLATVCWGSYIVVAKLATHSDYCNLPPRKSVILMTIGIAIVLTVYGLLVAPGDAPDTSPLDGRSVLAGTGAGLLWALGMVFALLALQAGAEVSRLVPLYNCNTLVAVLLGIVFLREVPNRAELPQVVCGALLVVGGGVLLVR